MKQTFYIIEVTSFNPSLPCPSCGYLISPSMDRFSNFSSYMEDACHFLSSADAWAVVNRLEGSFPSCVFDVVAVRS